MISHMEKSFSNYELDDLQIRVNQLEYRIHNQLGDDAFLLLLIETELDVFGKVSENTRNMVRNR